MIKTPSYAQRPVNKYVSDSMKSRVWGKLLPVRAGVNFFRNLRLIIRNGHFLDFCNVIHIISSSDFTRECRSPVRVFKLRVIYTHRILQTFHFVSNIRIISITNVYISNSFFLLYFLKVYKRNM